MAALNRTDADISIVVISPNSMLFAAHNNDPVLAAHQMASYIDNQHRNHSWYVPQYEVSVVASAEQRQICNLLNGASASLLLAGAVTAAIASAQSRPERCTTDHHRKDMHGASIRFRLPDRQSATGLGVAGSR
jgi:hypothetical protein